VTKFPEKSFAWRQAEGDFYHAPDFRPNLNALQQTIDLAYEPKFSKGLFDVKSYVDLSFIERAGKMLK
jgi:ABC-type nitrate/sulfonate/bicarbonate transport system substrate-binding protein